MKTTFLGIMTLIATLGWAVQPDAQKVKSDLQDMETLWKTMKEGPFRDFSSNIRISGTMEDISKGYRNLLTTYREFAKKDLKTLNQKLSEFEKSYGSNGRDIDKNVEAALGKRPQRRPSYMWDELKKGQEKLKAYPAAMSQNLLSMAKRDLDHVKKLSDRIRGQKFDQIKDFLDMALQFDPKNEEAKSLLETIAGRKKEEMGAIEKKIDEAEWNPHSAKFNGPGNPDTLAAAVEKFLEIDDKGKRKDSILAVRISGDWRVADKTITGYPLTYGLPVHVAYRPQKDPKTATVQSLTIVTRDAKKAPPFKTYWVGDSWRVRANKIKGGSSGGPNILFRLILAGTLFLSGIIAILPFLRSKTPGLADILETFSPLRGFIGVLTLGVGVLLFLVGIFHPFSDLIPQAFAVVTGLFLGLEILLKKPIPAQTPPPPPPGVTQASPPPPPAPGTVQGAPNLASSSAQKAQELLRRNESRIRGLEKFQVPLGFSCLFLSVVHLFMGGIWLF